MYLPARTRGRAVVLGDDVEVVEAGGAAQLRQDARRRRRRRARPPRRRAGRAGTATGSAVARLKRTRASTSSCGSGGSEEKVISGAEARPVHGDDGGDVPRLGARRRSGSAGRGCRSAVSEPSSNSMRWPRIRSRPRRRSNCADRLDVGRWCRWMRSAPPSSTSSPRPRTKIWLRRVDAHVEPRARAAGGSACAGAPTRARSRVTCTRGRRARRGVDLLERRRRRCAEALGDRDLGRAEVDAAREQPAAERAAPRAPARRRAGCSTKAPSV